MNTTRRTVLLGGAAAGALIAPLAAVTIRSNPDAELEALYAEWQAADTAETEAFNHADDARLAFRKTHPTPTVEVVNSKGETVTCASWDEITDALMEDLVGPAIRGVLSRAKETGGKFAQGEIKTIIGDGMSSTKQLQHEAHRRLKAAQVVWESALERSEVGHRDRLREEASARENAALETFISTPALTVSGVLCKLRAAGAWIHMMEGDNPFDVEDRLALSALADLERLTAEGVS
jgi:hypothetical protein